jgi:hypothetical protein
VRASRCAEISDYLFGTAAGLADLSDDRFGLLRATPVVNQNLRAGPGERECAGAADAARGAGDEGGFSGEIGHDRMPAVSRDACRSGRSPADPVVHRAGEMHVEDQWRTAVVAESSIGEGMPLTSTKRVGAAW